MFVCQWYKMERNVKKKLNCINVRGSHCHFVEDIKRKKVDDPNYGV